MEMKYSRILEPMNEIRGLVDLGFRLRLRLRLMHRLVFGLGLGLKLGLRA